MTERLKKIEMWQILTCMPLLIGVARAIHFSFTHYLLPDEVVYTTCIFYWFQGKGVLMFGSRRIFQLMLLGVSILFNLNTPGKFVPVLSIFMSIFGCLTLYFGSKIAEMYGLKERWIVPLLFLITPVWSVLTPLILTEVFSILLLTLVVYMFLKAEQGKIVHMLLSGVLCGVAYQFREPSAIVFAFGILFLLYHKQFKKGLVFGLSFMLFGASSFNYIWRWLRKILQSIELPIEFIQKFEPPRMDLVSEVLSNIESPVREQVYRFETLPVDIKSIASLPMFLSTSILDLSLMLIFSVGTFSTILAIYGMYKKRISLWIVTGFVVMLISAFHLARYGIYTVKFFQKMSTVVRYGTMGCFCIPFVPFAMKDWYRKKKILYFSFAIIGTSLLAIPTVGIIQSNLSEGSVNRLNILNYKAPWLILRDSLEKENSSSVLVICEPVNRVRFYLVEGIDYMMIPKEDFEETISKYEVVYLYGEKYSLYRIVLETNVKWYLDFIEDASNYETIVDNGEMYLYKVRRQEK